MLTAIRFALPPCRAWLVILVVMMAGWEGRAAAQHHHTATSGEPSYQLGALTISSPWSRATAPNAPVAAAYLQIINRGVEADRLISADFDGAGDVEIHESSEENGIARMRRLEPGLVVPAGATIELKPGGYHLMLMKLARGLSEGQTRKASLVFEKAGRVEILFAVLGIGAGHPSHGAHRHQ